MTTLVQLMLELLFQQLGLACSVGVCPLTASFNNSFDVSCACVCMRTCVKLWFWLLNIAC